MRRPNLFVVSAHGRGDGAPRTLRRPGVVFLPKPAIDPSPRAELTPGHFAEQLDQREASIERDLTGLRA